jgi:Rrf2 family nitric oxide-sensitive transcriptional repressor
MISQTAEYALRAIVYLARHEDQPRTTTQIAEATQVPGGYLAKVMQNLGRAGLVQSQRGLNGGFVLSRPPDETSALDVINAVDPIRRIHHCPLGLAEYMSLCPLHQRLDDAAGLIEDSFRGTSIAELTETTRSRTRCRFPCLSASTS